MRVRLFDSNEQLNWLGRQYSERIQNALEPILADAMNSGISIRDLEWMFAHSMSLRAALASAELQIAAAKAEAAVSP